MRADRLISILLLLQVHRQMTARDLARRLEVSERTIHRDMEALCNAGIPVVSERGVGGGWGLMERYRTDLTGLNREEIQALFLAKPSRLLNDLGLARASDAATIKLLAALPSNSRAAADDARQLIHIDTSGWSRPEESIACLSTIQEAIWQGRRMRIAYARGYDCDEVERVVDPLGMVAKGSVWYLVAGVEGSIRSYRVSRLTAASLLDESCVRPAGFDLARHWEESMASFKEKLPRYYATLLAKPDVVPRMYYAGRFARVEQVEAPLPDGRVKVKMRFQFEEEACEFVLGLGTDVEIVEPWSLRDVVLSQAREVVAFYDQALSASQAKR
jgi:predicted DNA-binding transcriptional regulator YafY